MSRHESRILLVQPDDVLLIGHAGNCDPEAVNAAAHALKDALGLRHVVVFAEDIDMTLLPSEAPWLAPDDTEGGTP